MKIFGLLVLFLFGAAMGSFVCCQVRRFRLGEKEGKKLGKRSVCLKCVYQLKWYDNVPIVSWLMLKGKCRKCHGEIGKMEIMAEVLTGVAFLMVGAEILDGMEVSNVFWIFRAVALMILTTTLMFLAFYDAKFSELPVFGLWLAIGMGAVVFGMDWAMGGNVVDGLIGVAIFAGLYFGLYKISGEKWVGGGDWMLCLALALALDGWWLCLVTICLANTLGVVVMLPQKKKKVAFGPFLVVAWVVVMCFRGSLMALGV